jgi:tetratricopeptide (TPR) repeat protein
MVDQALPVAGPEQLPALPLALRKALESGECVLFLGAGIGKNVRDSKGNPAPDGKELAKRLATHFKVDAQDNYDLSKISEIVELREGRKELETFVKDQLSDLEPDSALTWLASVRWRAIFTTNYDRVIERAYELSGRPAQKPVSFSLTPELLPYDPNFDVPIYHLHGSFWGHGKPSIVITQSDYVTFRESRHMLFELLKKEFATSTILYIGYSNVDPNWQTVLSEVRSEFFPSPVPPSFRVSPLTPALDAELLRAKGVETLDMEFDEFVASAASTLKEAAAISDILGVARKQIPSDLIAEFEKTPAALLRFLGSWTYVNQAPFSDRANTQDFLKGDRPNWALLAKKQYFERDVEDGIYDELLDFATSQAMGSTTLLLLGSAGYGTTTVLLSLATRLVSDNAGPVFLHRPGTNLTPGDIEYGASLFSEKRPFFIIDNAADHMKNLAFAAARMNDLKRPACFLMGDRTNEWRQRRSRFSPPEFELEALSDPEIYRLIAFLEANHALKALEGLKPDLQFAVIKSKHGKELLVVMRESTEDNSFDAILEDEFRGIGNDVGKRLYLAVCSLYQHGAYVRDNLLADILGYSVQEMYERTNTETEGVVVYELIEPARGLYAARARHRKIAEIVWIRCGDASEKEDILQRVLSHLNLQYGLDKDAFESLIRSDILVDSVRTLEGRTHFFETACQKAPLDPYVRQHYARMLYRAGKLQAALGQIDEAIELDKEVRVLYHTKGLILTRLATNAESPEIGRRHLVKAERAFRTGLTMYARDAYAFQGLATLFLEWAKRTPAEASDYVAKAEEVISEGLRVVQSKETLWLTSAEVQSFLGSVPNYKGALERAVNANPKSVIARYLLGRTLRRGGDSSRAIEILTPVIKEHPDEYRSCLEYALSMLDNGDKLGAAINVLKLGSLYGLRDPRYVATLGGMLFMDGKFTEADKIFEESRKQGFSMAEANTIHFRPSDPTDRTKSLRLVGKVSGVKTGYCFIETSGYPRFMCPGTKWNRIAMIPSLEISFSPAFSARGAQADLPQVVAAA